MGLRGRCALVTQKTQPVRRFRRRTVTTRSAGTPANLCTSSNLAWFQKLPQAAWVSRCVLAQEPTGCGKANAALCMAVRHTLVADSDTLDESDESDKSDESDESVGRVRPPPPGRAGGSRRAMQHWAPSTEAITHKMPSHDSMQSTVSCWRSGLS